MRDSLESCYINSCIHQEFSRKGLYEKHGSIHVTAYSNAGYAVDTCDRRSIIDYVPVVGRNLVNDEVKK